VRDANVRAEIHALTQGYADRGEYFAERLAEGVGIIAAAFYPKDVIVRLSDFKSNEYAGLLGGRDFEPEEGNPMLGFRGAFRYMHARYRDAFALECRALHRVRVQMGLTNVKLMVPFCRTPREGQRVLELLAANGLLRGENGLEVYVMAEIPSNAILADEFAALFDGFSIGSNDLTQLVLGVDRDSELVAPEFDELNPRAKRDRGDHRWGPAGGAEGRDLRLGAERLPRDGSLPRGEGDHQHLAESRRGGARPGGRRGRGGIPRVIAPPASLRAPPRGAASRPHNASSDDQARSRLGLHPQLRHPRPVDFQDRPVVAVLDDGCPWRWNRVEGSDHEAGSGCEGVGVIDRDAELPSQVAEACRTVDDG